MKKFIYFSILLFIALSLFYKTNVYATGVPSKLTDQYEQFPFLKWEKATNFLKQLDIKPTPVGIVEIGGFDEEHPLLKGKIKYINDRKAAQAQLIPTFHGTHVAGIITTATLGKTQLVLVSTDNGDAGELSKSIIDAVDHGAKVINCSWGGGKPSETIKEAIEYAKEKGVIIVFAAGNNSNISASYPARLSEEFSNVISVGSIGKKKYLSPFSNYGKGVEIYGPGEKILSSLGKDYRKLSGTSMSAPFITGLVGTMLSINPELNFQEIKSLLKKSTISVSDPYSVYKGLIKNGTIDTYELVVSTYLYSVLNKIVKKFQNGKETYKILDFLEKQKAMLEQVKLSKIIEDLKGIISKSDISKLTPNQLISKIIPGLLGIGKTEISKGAMAMMLENYGPEILGNYIEGNNINELGPIWGNLDPEFISSLKDYINEDNFCKILSNLSEQKMLDVFYNLVQHLELNSAIFNKISKNNKDVANLLELEFQILKGKDYNRVKELISNLSSKKVIGLLNSLSLNELYKHREVFGKIFSYLTMEEKPSLMRLLEKGNWLILRKYIYDSEERIANITDAFESLALPEMVGMAEKLIFALPEKLYQITLSMDSNKLNQLWNEFNESQKKNYLYNCLAKADVFNFGEISSDFIETISRLTEVLGKKEMVETIENMEERRAFLSISAIFKKFEEINELGKKERKTLGDIFDELDPQRLVTIINAAFQKEYTRSWLSASVTLFENLLKGYKYLDFSKLSQVFSEVSYPIFCETIAKLSEDTIFFGDYTQEMWGNLKSELSDRLTPEEKNSFFELAFQLVQVPYDKEITGQQADKIAKMIGEVRNNLHLISRIYVGCKAMPSLSSITRDFSSFYTDNVKKIILSTNPKVFSHLIRRIIFRLEMKSILGEQKETRANIISNLIYKYDSSKRQELFHHFGRDGKVNIIDYILCAAQEEYKRENFKKYKAYSNIVYNWLKGLNEDELLRFVADVYFQSGEKIISKIKDLFKEDSKEIKIISKVYDYLKNPTVDKVKSFVQQEGIEFVAAIINHQFSSSWIDFRTPQAQLIKKLADRDIKLTAKLLSHLEPEPLLQCISILVPIPLDKMDKSDKPGKLLQVMDELYQQTPEHEIFKDKVVIYEVKLSSEISKEDIKINLIDNWGERRLMQPVITDENTLRVIIPYTRFYEFKKIEIKTPDYTKTIDINFEEDKGETIKLSMTENENGSFVNKSISNSIHTSNKETSASKSSNQPVFNFEPTPKFGKTSASETGLSSFSIGF